MSATASDLSPHAKPRSCRPPSDLLAVLDPQEGFVLSRIDGRTSVAEICSLVPLEVTTTQAILLRLRELGAIDFPATATPEESLRQLDSDERARIDAAYLRMQIGDPAALLQVDIAADSKTVRRAYYRMSKEFHPDRYFGYDLGIYRERLHQIFNALKISLIRLTDSQ